jgi:endo-1,4-beta-mannosidase
MAIVGCVAHAAEGKFPEEGKMLVGVNFWGSKAGVHMWRADEWDEVEIEKDIAALAATGVEMVRVFPTWSEFQPLVREWKFKQAPGLVLREGSDEEIYDPLWLDPGAVARFEKFCDIAERHNVKLMVSLVTGWMSGRLFTPRIVENKNLITDPDAVMWEGRFARAFVRRMKGRKAIVAWDLGNECNSMGAVETGAQAWVWLNTISSAIRMEDPSRPVVSGMHSQTSNGYGAQWGSRNDWTLQMQGELLDVMTPHPYPASFRIEANRGAFNCFRNVLHPVSQCLFYSAVSGKPASPQR